MSAFLGKIHYWLYDKIQLQEKIIDNIIKLSKVKGYNCEGLVNESYTKYGFPVTGILENEIEHTNIHGWLQQRIISAENRLAYVVTELLRNDVVTKEEVADIFYKNGMKIMEELGISEGYPEDFFKLIFDYMLEGMPCDRVNEVIENKENEIIWRTTRCLHGDYWRNVQGDFNNFYYFRDSWINGFLFASGTGYKYTRTEDGVNVIRKE